MQNRAEGAVETTLGKSDDLGENATLTFSWVLFSLFHLSVRAPRVGTRSDYSLCSTALRWAWFRVDSRQCLLNDCRNGSLFSLFSSFSRFEECESSEEKRDRVGTGYFR